MALMDRDDFWQAVDDSVMQSSDAIKDLLTICYDEKDELPKEATVFLFGIVSSFYKTYNAVRENDTAQTAFMCALTAVTENNLVQNAVGNMINSKIDESVERLI